MTDCDDCKLTECDPWCAYDLLMLERGEAARCMDCGAIVKHGEECSGCGTEQPTELVKAG